MCTLWSFNRALENHNGFNRGWAARWRCPHWKWKVGAPQGTMARLGKCAGLRWKRDTVENLEKIWLKLEKIWRTCGETLVKTSQASPSSRRNHPMKWSQRKRWLRGCPIFGTHLGDLMNYNAKFYHISSWQTEPAFSEFMPWHSNW